MNLNEARDAFIEDIEAGLLKYAEAAGGKMPVIDDWIICAAISDLTQPDSQGLQLVLTPSNSWTHRVVGLMDAMKARLLRLDYK